MPKQLQQHLPLAVLKPSALLEYFSFAQSTLQQHLPLAVLKLDDFGTESGNTTVATALTACGIETRNSGGVNTVKLKLQQHLPLAVLKLQQYGF